MPSGIEEARRTLDEIITRYALEPELRDVFVEGPGDARILEYWFGQRGLRNAAAYEIETVAIPAALLVEMGLPNNNRGRVLALARRLRDAIGPVLRQVTCLVDADFDCLLALEGAAPPDDGPLVRRTDYSCMEMYLFREEAFVKFFSVACRVRSFDCEAFRRAIATILRRLFYVRAADHTLNLRMSFVELGGKVLDQKGGTPRLDEPKYVKTLLMSNGRMAIGHAFAGEVARHSAAAQAQGDDRYFIHGHDFLAILCWYARKCTRSFVAAGDEAITAAFWSCCESAFFTDEPLFVGLEAWAR